MRLRLSDVPFHLAPKQELWELSVPFGGMRTAISYPNKHLGARVILARTLFTGKLIGWCMYRPIQEPSEDRIHNDVMFWYYVHPAHRREGVGRMLARRAHVKAKRHFAQAERFAVSLHTNEVGMAFFKNVVPGYTPLACS